MQAAMKCSTSSLRCKNSAGPKLVTAKHHKHQLNRWACRSASNRDGLGRTELRTTEPASLTEPSTSTTGLPALPGGLSFDLNTADGQATCFNTLSWASVILAFGSILAPEQIMDLLLPASETAGYASYAGMDPTLMRVLGATVVISAAAEGCLADAAKNKRLGSATYQRLMVGCVIKSATYLTVFFMSPAVWTPQLVAAYVPLLAASLYTNVGTLLITNNKGGEQTIPDLSTKLPPQNAASWTYSVFMGVYLFTALACFAPASAPSLFTGEVGQASELLKHMWAPGFLLAATASLNLKDAAERNRLGASTFKRLNLGLAITEILYACVCAYAMSTRTAAGDAMGMSNLAASLGIASFCLYQWLYAKK